MVRGGGNRTKRKYRIGAALLAFVLSMLLIAPVLATENETPAINWLSIDASGIEQIYYIEGLDWFYINGGGVIERTTGAEVDYDAAYTLSDGLVCVEKNGKWGYVDTTGSVVVPLEYDYAGDFSEGLAWVGKEDTDVNMKYGYIDTTGSVVIPLEYGYASDFSEGLARVNGSDGYSDYIDKTGAQVIPSVNGLNFSEGLAPVMELSDSGRTWGYIDKTGAVVVPYEYNEVGNFPMVWRG